MPGALEEDPLTTGTHLHWVCRAAAVLPHPMAGRYAEVARWLSSAAPLALLLGDAQERTPLELLLGSWGPATAAPAANGFAEELLCAFCGERGHTGRRCPEVAGGTPAAHAGGAVALLCALAEGLSVAVDRYPWRAAARMLPLSALAVQRGPVSGAEGESGLRGAVEEARSTLLKVMLAGDPGEQAAVTGAMEALDRLRDLVTSPPAVPTLGALEATERLGALAAARARARAIEAVTSYYSILLESGSPAPTPLLAF